MLTRKYNLLAVFLLGSCSLLLMGCGGANLFDYFNNFWSLGCCGVIILVLDVIALLEVAGSARSLGSKVLWALLIIFAPILGCILYYLFGR